MEPKADLDIVKIDNPDGAGDFVLVCEHASNFVPTEFNGLGLDEAALTSHIAWDPGALAVGKHLAEHLNAPFVHAGASRLLYDCNRPASSISAIPEKSENTVIPGNQDLNNSSIEARVERFYEPFRTELTKVLEEQSEPVLVTIHSFTPVYKGKTRSVELGIIHDTDDRLAVSLQKELKQATDFKVRLNDPYGPEDEVTHTLRLHGVAERRLNVMVEIRNDLIATESQQAEMAQVLAAALHKAVDELKRD